MSVIITLAVCLILYFLLEDFIWSGVGFGLLSGIVFAIAGGSFGVGFGAGAVVGVLVAVRRKVVDYRREHKCGPCGSLDTYWVTDPQKIRNHLGVADKAAIPSVPVVKVRVCRRCGHKIFVVEG